MPDTDPHHGRASLHGQTTGPRPYCHAIKPYSIVPPQAPKSAGRRNPSPPGAPGQASGSEDRRPAREDPSLVLGARITRDDRVTGRAIVRPTHAGTAILLDKEPPGARRAIDNSHGRKPVGNRRPPDGAPAGGDWAPWRGQPSITPCGGSALRCVLMPRACARGYYHSPPAGAFLRVTPAEELRLRRRPVRMTRRGVRLLRRSVRTSCRCVGKT